METGHDCITTNGSFRFDKSKDSGAGADEDCLRRAILLGPYPSDLGKNDQVGSFFCHAGRRYIDPGSFHTGQSKLARLGISPQVDLVHSGNLEFICIVRICRFPVSAWERSRRRSLDQPVRCNLYDRNRYIHANKSPFHWILIFFVLGVSTLTFNQLTPPRYLGLLFEGDGTHFGSLMGFAWMIFGLSLSQDREQTKALYQQKEKNHESKNRHPHLSDS